MMVCPNVQCKSQTTLCEHSKFLIALEQLKVFLNTEDSDQDLSWTANGDKKANIQLETFSDEFTCPHLLLWDWTGGSIENDKTGPYKVYFQTLKKYIYL